MNSIIGVPKSEWKIYEAAELLCKAAREEFKDILTEQKLNEIIEHSVERFKGLITNPEQLFNYLNEQISRERRMPNASVMKSNEVRDSDWWTKFSENNECEHWKRYFKHLQDSSGWDQDSIEKSVDLPTDEIMNSIIDPTKEYECERRGMVVGYVQSGKTANYIGLINKAIDAGYKIIIVLAGMHNNLRAQTQSRVDEEVLGYETSNEVLDNQIEAAASNIIGVGKYRVDTFVQTLTTRDEQGDFNKAKMGTTLALDLPIVIVTKKVKSILENLYKNYYQHTSIEVLKDGTKKMPAKYPLLIIDDEADQASINNNVRKGNKEAEEIEPTSINRLIRQILNLFSSKAYVGYTATPYANIFINNAEINPNYGFDLFPKDFIISLPKPKKYVGANEFFGSENIKAMPLFRNVSNNDFISVKDGYVGDLPDDLKNAIRSFLIAIAIRNCRGYKGKPNSMLIHGARINELQSQIKNKVHDFYIELKNEIINKDKETYEIFENIFDNDFIKTTSEMLKEQSYYTYMESIEIPDKKQVFEEIYRLCKENKISIYIINGKSKDVLKYKDMEKQGKEYNVIAIGGDKLSRGLTLEGLSISYFIRQSKTYDTLMQMGRWFGFRNGYIDLCRVYTTVSLKNAFHKIAFATDDLRGQIEYMCDIEEQPETFGLKVASDPELKISNKIHNPVEQYLDFSESLIQTRIFDKKAEVYNINFDAVDKLLRKAGHYISLKDYNTELGKNGTSSKSLVWTNVSGQYIKEFLMQYKTSSKAQKIKSYNIAKYVEEQLKVGGLKEWTVCLRNVRSKDDDIGNTIKGLAGLVEIGAGITRTNKDGDNCYEVDENTLSIKSVRSNEHELLDCEQSIIKSVKLDYEKKKNNGEKIEQAFVRKECRRRMKNSREKALLILYPINYRNKKYATSIFNIEGVEHKTPFGFMIVFPNREGKGEAVSYILNPVAAGGELVELFE